MIKRGKLFGALILGGWLALGLAGGSAQAHPMGNFSINQYSQITVGHGTARVLYLVDMAEIPTFQELSNLGVAEGGALTARQRTRYLAKEARTLAGGLRLSAGGRPLPLRLQASDLIFPPGAGGLTTERIYLVLDAPLPGRASALRFSDSNFSARTGWKEIVVRADGGARLQSPAPSKSRSRALTVYPVDATSSPPQDTSVTIRVHEGAVPAGSLAAPAAMVQAAEAPLFGTNGGWSSLARGLTRVGGTAAKGPSHPSGWSAGRSDALTEMMGRRDLPLGVLLLTFVAAFWFGAGHALSPGHGKTVVGAYLVGTKGRPIDAVILGSTVTVTHTAGVFALGLVTLYLSRYVLPDQLYPVLGFISGLLVAAMGVSLGVGRLRRLHAATSVAHDHTHDHEHPHDHDHAHSHSHHDHEGAAITHRHGLFGGSHSHLPGETKPAGRRGLGGLIALGISGGLLPCPSALVVLLSAIAFHRLALGLLLIVAFSMGLATVLTGIGLLLVVSQRITTRLSLGSESVWGSRMKRGLRVLPVLSAGFVACLGLAIAVGAASPGTFPALLRL